MTQFQATISLGLKNKNRKTHGETQLREKSGRIIRLARPVDRNKNIAGAKCAKRKSLTPEKMPRIAQISGVLRSSARFLSEQDFIIQRI
ncbi:hypothetical protein [Cellvibrio mixtus]|uniref:hypothetical protein n=1 Tax=Cellvibrio mixtus TaxID=39650 RepID=UPI00190F8783|nr:hypothetical protein [Cellvibrio mixtus]